MRSGKSAFTRAGFALLIASTYMDLTAQQNSWQQVSDLAGNMTAAPSRRWSVACFAIGDKGFMATGYNTSNYTSSTMKELWMFDESTGQWTRKTDLPGSKRLGAVAFSIGTKGYVGLGGTSVGSAFSYGDLWEYDPSNGGWTQKADLPVGGRMNACAFAVGGKGYVTTGKSATYLHDLWAYDPVSNTWTQRADMPGAPRSHATAFAAGGQGYVACGYDGTYRSDVWRYEPATDTWLQRADMGGGIGRRGPASFVLNDQGYVTGGVGGSVMDLWRYDAPSDAWIACASAFGPAMSQCAAFATSQYGYLHTIGSPMGTEGYFQRYDPVTNTWAILAIPGGFGRVWAAGFSADGKGYVAGGVCQSTSTDMWEYDPSTNAWARRATSPSLGEQNAAGMNIGSAGYMCNGYDGLYYGGVYEYEPSTDQWISRGFPMAPRSNGVAFAIGNKGYVGFGASDFNFDFTYHHDLWEYDPVTLAWTQKASCPNAGSTGCAGFGANGKGYVALGTHSVEFATDMWEYDPVQNTWTQLPDPPMGPRTLLVSFAIGNKGYVGTGKSENMVFNDMWEFDAVTHTWLQVADVPGGLRLGATSFVLNDEGYVGTGGYTAMDFWKYTPVTTPGIRVSAKAFLQGNYDQVTQLMNDQLRGDSLLPTVQPYSAMGYTYVSSLGGTTNVQALDVTGPNAIVDWVVLELRASGSPATVVCSRSALLQRDGDVVDMDGVSSVLFSAPAGSYFVAVRHRNHLGVMIGNPMALSATTTTIDLTEPGTVTYGNGAQEQIGTRMVMWAGDTSGDGVLKYTGMNNDRDPILQAIGGIVPTSTVSNVYDRRDVNLNGEIKYMGTSNDSDPILSNIGGVVPTNTRTHQLP